MLKTIALSQCQAVGVTGINEFNGIKGLSKTIALSQFKGRTDRINGCNGLKKIRGCLITIALSQYQAVGATGISGICDKQWGKRVVKNIKSG